MAITDKQIREFRDQLPLIPYSYDAQFTIKIALGKRLPYEGMSQQQARLWVERAVAESCALTGEKP